jgi:hypothetical protein
MVTAFANRQQVVTTIDKKIIIIKLNGYEGKKNPIGNKEINH